MHFLHAAEFAHRRMREREIGNSLPNIQRQRCTCYALCHILNPVSAALTSIFRMDSNSTSYPPLVQREAAPGQTPNASGTKDSFISQLSQAHHLSDRGSQDAASVQ